MPLAIPPGSSRTPGARTTRSSPSRRRRSRTRQTAGAAGRRGGAEASATSTSARVGRLPVPGVAGQLELAEQRGVDEPVAVVGRPQGGRDRAPQQGGGGDRRARVAVEPAQLAVGVEAREGGLDRLDLRVDAVGERRELGLVEQHRLEPHPRLAAHRGEGQVDLGHDWWVVGADEEPSGTAGAGAATAGDEAVVLRLRRLLLRRGAAAQRGIAARLELAGEEREDDEEEGDGARRERAATRARGGMRPMCARSLKSRLRNPPTLSELSVTVPMLLP